MSFFKIWLLDVDLGAICNMKCPGGTHTPPIGILKCYNWQLPYGICNILCMNQHQIGWYWPSCICQYFAINFCPNQGGIPLLDLRLELRTWFDLLLECTTWTWLETIRSTWDSTWTLWLACDWNNSDFVPPLLPTTHGSLFDHKVLSGFHMMQLEGKANGYPAQGYIIELWNYIMAFYNNTCHESFRPWIVCGQMHYRWWLDLFVCTMWTNPSYHRERNQTHI